MNVKELYEKISERIPEVLRMPWDNDGVMCCTDSSADVRRVLIALDVTDEVVDYAIEGDFDLIISHHPLIFKPLCSISDESHIARKVIKLINAGISVFSFHTRADAVEGGVNDILADLVGLYSTERFGEGGLGRVGELDEEMSLDDFASSVKLTLGVDSLRVSDGYNTVKRVAVLGGDGKDFVADAIEAGADTFVSGRISYNIMAEASEMGINLIEAGHFFTEHPVTEFFAGIIRRVSADIYVQVVNSNVIRVI